MLESRAKCDRFSVCQISAFSILQ